MKRKGFTLVELMVVVAIISILSAVAISSYNRISAKGKWGEVPGCLSDTVLRLENYYSNHGEYPTANAWDTINGSLDCGNHYVGTISVFGDGNSRYIVSFTDTDNPIWADGMPDTWAVVECTTDIFHVENAIEPENVDVLPPDYSLP